MFQMGWNHQLDNLRIIYLDPPRGCQMDRKGSRVSFFHPWSLTAGTWNSGFLGIRKLWVVTIIFGSVNHVELFGGWYSLPKLTAHTWKWMVGSDERWMTWFFWGPFSYFRGVKLAVSSREGDGFKHTPYPAQKKSQIKNYIFVAFLDPVLHDSAVEVGWNKTTPFLGLQNMVVC